MLPRSNGPLRGRVGARSFKPRLVALMRVVVFVGVLIACIHASVWAVSRDIISAPAINGQLASVSYTPFDTHPDGARPSSPEQIRADLKAIAPYTRMVRTYSSTGGAELVPEVAPGVGLRGAVGGLVATKN